MVNGDFVNGIIFDNFFLKIVRENGFIHKLTIMIFSSLSSMNIC